MQAAPFITQLLCLNMPVVIMNFSNYLQDLQAVIMRDLSLLKSFLNYSLLTIQLLVGMLGITPGVTYDLLDIWNLLIPHMRALTIKAPSFSILTKSIFLLAKPLTNLFGLTTRLAQDLPGPHTDIKKSVGCVLSGNRLVKTMMLKLLLGLLWKRMMIHLFSQLLGLDTIILMPWPEDREASTIQQNL